MGKRRVQTTNAQTRHLILQGRLLQTRGILTLMLEYVMYLLIQTLQLVRRRGRRSSGRLFDRGPLHMEEP